MKGNLRVKAELLVRVKLQQACKLTNSEEYLVSNLSQCSDRLCQVRTEYGVSKQTTSITFLGQQETNLQILIISLMKSNSIRMRLIRWQVICRRSITCYREVKRWLKNKSEACPKKISKSSNVTLIWSQRMKKMYAPFVLLLWRREIRCMNWLANIFSILNVSTHGLKNRQYAPTAEET